MRKIFFTFSHGPKFRMQLVLIFLALPAEKREEKHQQLQSAMRFMQTQQEVGDYLGVRVLNLKIVCMRENQDHKIRRSCDVKVGSFL